MRRRPVILIDPPNRNYCERHSSFHYVLTVKTAAVRAGRVLRLGSRGFGPLPFFLRFGTLFAVGPPEDLTSLRSSVAFTHQSTLQKRWHTISVSSLSFRSYPIRMKQITDVCRFNSTSSNSTAGVIRCPVVV